MGGSLLYGHVSAVWATHSPSNIQSVCRSMALGIRNSPRMEYYPLPRRFPLRFPPRDGCHSSFSGIRSHPRQIRVVKGCGEGLRWVCCRSPRLRIRFGKYASSASSKQEAAGPGCGELVARLPFRHAQYARKHPWLPLSLLPGCSPRASFPPQSILLDMSKWSTFVQSDTYISQCPERPALVASIFGIVVSHLINSNFQNLFRRGNRCQWGKGDWWSVQPSSFFGTSSFTAQV